MAHLLVTGGAGYIGSHVLRALRKAGHRAVVVDDLRAGREEFVRGVPLYGTLIGLEVHGDPAVGVVYLPALDELVAAARGLGCTWNGRPCRVSAVSQLDEALVAVTDERNARRRSGAYARLAEATALQRTWADCYAYVLVATGRAMNGRDGFIRRFSSPARPCRGPCPAGSAAA